MAAFTLFNRLPGRWRSKFAAYFGSSLNAKVSRHPNAPGADLNPHACIYIYIRLHCATELGTRTREVSQHRGHDSADPLEAGKSYKNKKTKKKRKLLRHFVRGNTAQTRRAEQCTNLASRTRGQTRAFPEAIYSRPYFVNLPGPQRRRRVTGAGAGVPNLRLEPANAVADRAVVLQHFGCKASTHFIMRKPSQPTTQARTV